jgi:hypothetical protein
MTQNILLLVYYKVWWFGCIIIVNENSVKVTISFLHPQGPLPSCVYPQQPDILSIQFLDVLMRVDPRRATGRIYTLTTDETQLTAEK